jgi:hypothetical protein
MLNPVVQEVTTGLEKVVTVTLSSISSALFYEVRANASVKIRHAVIQSVHMQAYLVAVGHLVL